MKTLKMRRIISLVLAIGIIGGLGSAIAEVLTELYPKQLTRMGIPDTFGKSGKAEELMKHFKITAEDIVEKFL